MDKTLEYLYTVLDRNTQTQTLDIESYYCSGVIKNSLEADCGGHAFNVIRNDDKYYVIDFSVPVKVMREGKIWGYAPYAARIDDEKITNWGEVILAKELASNRDADVLIVRGDELVNVKLAPAERWGMVADGARRADPQPQGLFRAMYSGARKTYYESKTLVVVLKQIITGERSSKQLGSFITIAQYSGLAMAAGFFSLLSLIALLSVNLGVLNLLPLPVLDGGYLLILIIEGITRRKLQGRGMEIAIMCGWVLILGLFILTMWNDLARVFGL